MTRRLALAVTAISILVRPTPAWSAGPLQRYALVVGANAGGADRPRLRYAISDAERFARVMIELGGVAPADEVVLRQPKVGELVHALEALTRRVADAKRAAAGGRIEIVVYYSGHADEQGLLLGEDRYSYRSLRERLDEIPADVRIAVLDACASGAFTRIKGGRARPPFLVDESAAMRGHAFLTSSAETEAAQESDRIHASYFTHFLISGFRGAADLSGDGKVTLSEAYQFAFNETLGRTVDTKGGAQHPSYDINLSGTGDVVMTDVRQTTATLVLGEDLEGRFFVRTASQDLVVELYKPIGRRVELAVEPGSYEVRVERPKAAMIAKTQVADGGRVVLEARAFGETAVETTRRRGDEPAPSPPPMRYAVDGRNRLALLTGMWRTGTNGATATVGASALDVFGGFEYTRFVREDLAVTISAEGFGVEAGVSTGPRGTSVGDVAGFAMPIGVKWNPLRHDTRRQPIKPFLLVGGGLLLGAADGAFVGNGTVSTGGNARAALVGRVGAGVDIVATRAFSFGVSVAYNATSKFSQPIGLRDDFSGPQVAVSLGWMFGKGVQ
jgi:hypothetical protein